MWRGGLVIFPPRMRKVIKKLFIVVLQLMVEDGAPPCGQSHAQQGKIFLLDRPDLFVGGRVKGTHRHAGARLQGDLVSFYPDS